MTAMDIMIDLETLGTSPGCIVLSVGAVGFDRKTGAILHEFYRVIDWADSQKAGLCADAQTVAWWASQSDKARAIFGTGEFEKHNLALVSDEFADWLVSCGREACPIWAHGATFDIPIWEAAMAAVDRRAPWSFWNFRDTRTVYDVTGFSPASVAREGTHHNALDDARHQTKCLCAALAKIRAEE